MLYDQKGNKVVVSDKLNTKTHPQIFARLRETKEPLDHHRHTMFSIECRARYKV